MGTAPAKDMSLVATATSVWLVTAVTKCVAKREKKTKQKTKLGHLAVKYCNVLPCHDIPSLSINEGSWSSSAKDSN